jgi:hypothetical protein
VPLGRHMRGIAMRLHHRLTRASLGLIVGGAVSSRGNGVVFIPHDHLLTPSVSTTRAAPLRESRHARDGRIFTRAALERLFLPASWAGHRATVRRERLFVAAAAPKRTMGQRDVGHHGQPQWRRSAAADALGTALLAISQHQPSAARTGAANA